MSEIEHRGLQTIYETPYSCSYCGDHIAIGWAFCPECGTPTGKKPAELDREKNPLTCDGCAYESLKEWCRLCARCGKPRPDYYVQKNDSEPKGEPNV